MKKDDNAFQRIVKIKSNEFNYNKLRSCETGY